MYCPITESNFVLLLHFFCPKYQFYKYKSRIKVIFGISIQFWYLIRNVCLLAISLDESFKMTNRWHIDCIFERNEINFNYQFLLVLKFSLCFMKVVFKSSFKILGILQKFIFRIHATFSAYRRKFVKYIVEILLKIFITNTTKILLQIFSCNIFFRNFFIFISR